MTAAGVRSKREADEVARELSTMLQSVDDPKQERALRKRFEERGKRAGRRAEWDELRLAVDTVGLWHRDRLAAALGANDTMLDSEAVGGAPDTHAGDAASSMAALAMVLDARRSLELNVHPGLALEALFHRLSSVPGGRVEMGR